MNSKERAFLRGQAMKMPAILTIGKGGVTAEVIAQLDDALEARELIKINVLKNSDLSAKDIAADIAKQAEAEVVQTMGNKITLFRFSKKEGVKHLLLI